MNEASFWLLLVFLLTSLVLSVVILLRLPREQNVSEFREELRAGREDASRAARDSREELSKNFRDANDTVVDYSERSVASPTSTAQRNE